MVYKFEKSHFRQLNVLMFDFFPSLITHLTKAEEWIGIIQFIILKSNKEEFQLPE